MTARAAQPVLDLPPVGGARRHLPEVVAASGTVLDSPFLTDDAVSALVVAVAPPLEEEDGLQPRAGTVHAAAPTGSISQSSPTAPEVLASAARPAR
ncbi:hypothetical protein NKG05_23550 [Oerskovia sp. M15]